MRTLSSAEKVKYSYFCGRMKLGLNACSEERVQVGNCAHFLMAREREREREKQFKIGVHFPFLLLKVVGKMISCPSGQL